MNKTLSLTTAVATVCTALYATASAAAPRYQITQLNTIATAVGTYAVANSINDKGQVAGGESALTGTANTGFRVDWSKTRPITWSATGAATLLPTLANNGGIATSLNNAGLIAGVSASTIGSFPPTRATLFRSSSATMIPPQGASNYSRVAGVNASGVVLVEDSARTFRFDSVGGLITQAAGANYYGPIAINDTGRFVADPPTTASTPPPAARFDPGSSSPTALFTTDGTGIVSDFNNNGTAVGRYRARFGGNYFVASSFNGATPTTFTIGSFTAGFANGLNDRGDIVGIVGDGFFTARVGKPFLRRDGVMIDLSTLIAGGTLPAGFNPIDINDRGQIIGQGPADDDNDPNTPLLSRAYVLNPIRNPGDANNDSVVNFDDLVPLAQNYNKSGENSIFWESGDFNYDRIVNFDDLTVLAQNYNKPANFSADWTLAESLVPEPTTTLLAGGVTMLVGRRR